MSRLDDVTDVFYEAFKVFGQKAKNAKHKEAFNYH